MEDYNLKLAPVWIRVRESGSEQSEYIIHTLGFSPHCVTRIKANFYLQGHAAEIKALIVSSSLCENTKTSQFLKNILGNWLLEKQYS